MKVRVTTAPFATSTTTTSGTTSGTLCSAILNAITQSTTSTNTPIARIIFLSPRINSSLPLSTLKDLSSSLATSKENSKVPTLVTLVSAINSLTPNPSTSSFAIADFHSATLKAKAFHINKQFTSESPFRRDKPVGRWFDPLSLKDAKSSHAFDVSQFSSVSTNTASSHLSDTLNLEELLGDKNPELIVTLSDRDPHAIWESLGVAVPKTKKMGLITPLTPFTTTLTHTLIHPPTIHDSGLLGLSFYPSPTSTSPTSTQPTPTPTPAYNNLTPASPYLPITSCQGNIILTLASLPSTTQILAALAHEFEGTSLEARIAGDKAIYMQRGDTGCVYRVVAGDLRKGNIAVDTTRDLRVGMEVRFLIQEKGVPVLDVREEGVRFVTCRESEVVGEEEEEERRGGGEGVVVSDRLLVASECGVVHDVQGEKGGFEIPISRLLENNATLLVAICHVPFVGEKATAVANGVLALLGLCSDRSGLFDENISCSEIFIKRLLAIKVVQFEHKEKDLNDILRDNSITTMLLTTYIRQNGAHFLHHTIPKTIESLFPILNNCEMDPLKMKHVSEQNDVLAEVLAKNQVHLVTVCATLVTVFLEKAAGGEDGIPKSVQRVCRFLGEIIERPSDLTPALKPPPIPPQSPQLQSIAKAQMMASPTGSFPGTPRKMSMGSLHNLLPLDIQRPFRTKSSASLDIHKHPLSTGHLPHPQSNHSSSRSSSGRSRSSSAAATSTPHSMSKSAQEIPPIPTPPSPLLRTPSLTPTTSTKSPNPKSPNSNLKSKLWSLFHNTPTSSTSKLLLDQQQPSTPPPPPTRGMTASAPSLDDQNTSQTSDKSLPTTPTPGVETVYNSAEDFTAPTTTRRGTVTVTLEKLSAASLQRLGKRASRPSLDSQATPPMGSLEAGVDGKVGSPPAASNLQINIIGAPIGEYAFLKREDVEVDCKSEEGKGEEDGKGVDGLKLGKQETELSTVTLAHSSSGLSVATVGTGVHLSLPLSRKSSLKTNGRSLKQKQTLASANGATENDGSLSLIEKVIGSLLFLRYLVPTIITPDVIPPTPAHRRGLILAGKVLTAASNGVEFGVKEDYMMPLNTNLKEYRYRIKEFVDTLLFEQAQQVKAVRLLIDTIVAEMGAISSEISAAIGVGGVTGEENHHHSHVHWLVEEDKKGLEVSFEGLREWSQCGGSERSVNGSLLSAGGSTGSYRTVSEDSAGAIGQSGTTGGLLRLFGSWNKD
ncbi:hypothetical protein HDU79_007302 [Rhizoclosmatium sp. JEL0117]|nr:hypothetical protein HDU79_007302 [Rhizoclosmatium sp. JEL0117]